MKRIAILRCEKLPSFVTWEVPNLDELFDEDDLLIRGFESQGFKAFPIAWNDPNVDWNKFDIAIIRSTWDYLDRPELFLKVLSDIESSSCKLYNPLATVRWNMDKRYLFDLEKLGVQIIPTYLVSDIQTDELYKLFYERQWQMVILKPTIGLGGSHSYRVPLDELGNSITKLQDKHPQQEYLVQPFIEDIITEGEWSFIYFNQQLSHVLLKKAAPNDYRVQELYGGTIQAVNPLPHDLLLAETVMKKIPFDFLFTRLDFVRVRGQLSIMEIELIEPVLSFKLVPESIMRFINAFRMKLDI